MADDDKRLERMRANPKGYWRIQDVEAVCRANGVNFSPPKKSSHSKVSHPSMRQILTVPFDRPIKPVYIKKLVNFIDVAKLNMSMAAANRAGGKKQ